MKTILFTLYLSTLSFLVQAEITEKQLQQNDWSCINLFAKDTSVHEYQLQPKSESRQHGNFVTFNISGTFESYDRGKCGNDCYTTVHGTYFIDKENQYLHLQINNMQYRGDCTKPTDYFDDVRVTFSMKMVDGVIVLEKV